MLPRWERPARNLQGGLGGNGRAESSESVVIRRKGKYYLTLRGTEVTNRSCLDKKKSDTEWRGIVPR